MYSTPTMISSQVPKSINGIPWSLFTTELYRLYTYGKYPQSAEKSALLLARDGFVYTGSGTDDTVICAFCTLQHRGWRKEENINYIHRTLSPSCCMAAEMSSHNHCAGNTAFGSQAPIMPMTFSTDAVANSVDVSHIPESVPTFSDSFDCIESDAVASMDPDSGGEYDGYEGDFIHFGDSTGSSPLQFSSANTLETDASVTILSDNIPHLQTPASATVAYNNDSHEVPEISEEGVYNNSHPFIHHQFPTSSSVAISSISAVTNYSSPSSSSSSAPSEVSSSAASTISAVSMSTGYSSPSEHIGSYSSNSTRHTAAPSVSDDHPVISDTVSTVISSSELQVDSPAASVTATNTASPSQSHDRRPTPTWMQLGIFTEIPKRPELALKESRRQTFQDWPVDHHIHVEDLVEAGFYYSGYSDCARCFFCGGGLRNWELEDNVFVEHVRWFPKCAFIRKLLKPAFFEAVQTLHNSGQDTITLKAALDRVGLAESEMIQDDEMSIIKNNLSVKTLIEFGYDEMDVFNAAKALRSDMDGEDTLCAESLFKKLVMEGKQRKRRSPNTCSHPPAAKKQTKSIVDINELKSKTDELRKQKTCKVCLERPLSMLFLPCGHLACCSECSTRLADCPICRMGIKGTVRVANT